MPSASRHAELGHHCACDARDLLNIRCGAAGYGFGVEYKLLRDAPAHGHGDLRFELLPGHGKVVALRQRENQAERPAPRNDRRLVDRIVTRNIQADNGVARFMVRCQFPLIFGHDERPALRSHHDPILRALEILHGDKALAKTCREQGRLVHQVREVGTREARGSPGNGA